LEQLNPVHIATDCFSETHFNNILPCTRSSKNPLTNDFYERFEVLTSMNVRFTVWDVIP
jgi:hypothetical protein